MIIEYDKDPAASPERKIQTLAESVQRALNSVGVSFQCKTGKAWQISI